MKLYRFGRMENKNDKFMPDKELLLQDLCMRLPYDTIVNIDNGKYREDVKLRPCHLADFNTLDIRPYLRSMPEMTDEERNELYELTHAGSEDWTFSHNAYVVIDWLNSKYFDYRGLIPKGLALKARENMYK